MSGRNPMGARLPPTAEPQAPRLLPDGSESQDHNGSFHSYMAHKISKLGDQFQANAAVQQQTQLFKGVGIHVNGFTTPSHLELKQLMALHGGTFHNYFHRSWVTHIICSNLPDAKVKEYERARQPVPVVRPQWVVDSIRAGQLLPIQGYALYQLRDAPGQRKLKAFQQARPAALPPEAIFGEQAGALGSALEEEQGDEGPSAAGAAGAVEVAPSTAQDVQTAPALGQQLAAAHPDTTAVAAAEATPAAAHGAAPGLRAPQAPAQAHGLGEATNVAAEACAHSPGPQQAPAVAAAAQPLSTMAPVPPGSVLAPSPGRAAAAARPVSPAPTAVRPVSPAAARARSPASAAAISAGYDPAEMRQAQQLAAKLRSECDGLRGPPKTSREDPHFVDTYFKNSRLHFIGSWKARIEALVASSAGSQGPAAQPPSAAHPRTIIHLDMDCFFASVAENTYPILKGKPVAVSHSNSASGTGEVSTSNYEARKYGVRSGMMISQAKELCPALVVVPYMFEQYEAVSEKVYRILLRRTACVEALSCDEAYLDVTGLGDPQQLAAEMRAEIEQSTGCTASAGIGPNLLLARIAGERAKPNGQFQVDATQARDFLQGLAVDALPGVGWSTREQLADKGIATVADLQASSKGSLQSLLGPKQGAMLWDFAHGKDNRAVEPVKTRKSVGAECNYALRFQVMDDAFKVLDDLAGEVQERMRRAGVKGRTITLKLKRRKPGAVEPRKFLGHGDCDNLSRSANVARFTDAAADIARESRALLLALRVLPADIRGLGIQMTKLDNDSGAAGRSAAVPAGLAAFLQMGQQQAAANQQLEAAVPQQEPQRQAEAVPLAVQQQRHWQGQQQQREPPRTLAAQAAPPALQQEQQEQDAAPAGLAPELPTAQQPQTLAGGSPGAASQRPPAQGAEWRKSPAKQVSLEQALHRAGASAAQSSQQDPHAVEERSRLLHQWQGVSLSQMDAAALEALPWEVQRELIGAMQQQPQQAQQQQQGQQLGQPAAPAQDHSPAHEGRLAHPGPHPDAAAGASGEEEEAAVAAAAAAERARGKRPLELPPPDSTQQAQQPPGDPHQQHWPLLGNTGGAGSSRAVGRAAGQVAGSPIVALPALSQVDRSVLDALPLTLRRELEHAYGIGRPAAAPEHGRRGGRGAGAGSMQRHVSKRQRIDSFVANPLLLGTTPHGQEVPARHLQPQQPQQQQHVPQQQQQHQQHHVQQQQEQLSLSQVDPSVLRELPEDLRQEVLQQLRQQQQGSVRASSGAAGRGGARPQHRSRLGELRDQEQAWQQHWQEELGMTEAQVVQQAQHADVMAMEQDASPGDAGMRAAEEGEDSEGGQEREAELPQAVVGFLQRAEHADSVQSLAAALGECLQELERQLAEHPASSSPPAQQQRDQHGQQAGAASPDPSASAGSDSDNLAGSPARDAPAAALAAPSPAQGRGSRVQTSPREDSMQRRAEQADEGAAAAGSASSALRPALRALRRSLRQACSELLAARDLEQLRLLLRAVQLLGEDHPWFASGAGNAAVSAAQRGVQARYGWPLRLAGLLQQHG